MFSHIIDWFNDFLSIDDDDDIIDAVEKDHALLEQRHLDGRWEPCSSSADHHSSSSSLYRFNCRYQIPDYERDGGNASSQVLNPEYVALGDVVKALQFLNQEQQISTLAQPISSSASRDGSISVASSSSSFLDNFGSGSVSGMNQRQRRLRQLRFEYRMLKKRKRRALRQLQRKQYWRDTNEMLYDVEAELEKHDDSDDSDHGSDDKLQTGESKSRHDMIHIMRDFDDLQQRHVEALEDTKDLEDQQRMFLQREQKHLDKELEILDRCIQSYLYAPLQKDEYYRSINNELFQDFDDDPARMVVDDIPVSTGRKVKENYPKLRVMSKQSSDERTRRRYLMLSSPFVANSESLSHSQPNANVTEWEIETERISGLLGHFIPGHHGHFN